MEIAGEHVQVFTGLRMRAYLAVKLGPRRALRVIQFVQRALTSREVSSKHGARFRYCGVDL
jgi:hypothetical protein